MNKFKKILIVDDEKDILHLLSNAISRKFQVEIITAENLNDAQGKIAKYQPDLALLDLNLPDGEGFELVPILKKEKPTAKFAIVTAYNQMQEHRKSQELGAVRLIGKPFSLNDVFTTVSEMLH